MNNAKKLLLTILFLFCTIIFQICIIRHLGTLDRELNHKMNEIRLKESQLHMENSENPPVYNDIDIKENEHNTTDSLTIPSTDSDYSDLDIVTSDDNLMNLFHNSVFIGDSRTEAIRRFTSLGSYADFCCDIGATITKLTENHYYIRNEEMTIYEAVSKYHYDKILIALGYNELGWQNEDYFIEKYKEMIQQLRLLSPDSDIYVQAILHIASDANVDNEMENNDRINLYNQKLLTMCSELGVTYLDVNEAFTDSQGYLFSAAASDGIHFNAEYCQKFVYQLIKKLG